MDRPIFLLTVLAAAACGPSEAPRGSDLSTRIDSVNGIERITIGGDAPSWGLEVIAEIGSEGTAAEQAPDEFAWVSSVTLGDGSQLYVADIFRDEIMVFDSLGSPLSRFGREGEGPGEFDALYSLAWAGDTLLTLDIGNARLCRRTPEGDWLTCIPSPGRLVASPVTYRLYQVGPREIYQWAYRPDEDVLEPSWRGHGVAAGREWRRSSLAIDATVPDRVVCTMGRGISWFDHPLAARSLAHPAPGATVYLATTDSYRVIRVDEHGDTLRVLERDTPAPSVSDEVWQIAHQAFEGWLADKDQGQCQPRTLQRPDRKPAIESLMVDRVGRLWVERNLTVGTLWEVFSDEGELLGSLPGFDHDRQRTVPWLGPSRLAWVSRDSLDIPRVHLARVVSTPSGG